MSTVDDSWLDTEEDDAPMPAFGLGPAPTERLGVPTSGRWVQLERLRPDQVPALHALVSEGKDVVEWPLAAGPAMSVSELGDHLFALQGLQMVVVQRENERIVGLVQGMALDRRSGTVDLGVVFGSDGWRAGWPMEGVILFLDYLISGLGLRKVYLEMAEETIGKAGGALKDWLVPEVTFRDHLVAPDGSYQDLHLWSLHRERWDTQLIRRLTGNT